MVDFFIGIGAVGNIKPALAVTIAFIFGINFLVNSKQYSQRFIPIYVFVIISVYIVLWNGVGQINLIITPVFGWLMSQNKKLTHRIIIYIFAIQFIAVAYEAASHNFIYTAVSYGVLKENAYDIYEAQKLFSITGFRPKGIFPGTLFASSFTIYFTLINRNNISLLMLSMIMALLVNTRLGIIIVALTLIIHTSYKYNTKISNPYLRFIANFIVYTPLFVMISYIFISLTSTIKLRNFMQVFNLDSASNIGRVFRYDAAYSYFSDGSFLEMLFGVKEYILYDNYGRVIPPESEILGMLLEIGILGFSLYIITIYKNIKWTELIYDLKTNTISSNYGLIISVVAMIVYRHVLGNLRGFMFWYYIFTI
jgi:hypothetical protein